MSKIRCTVDQLSPLTSGVTRVLLTPEHPVPYQPGQYLQIWLSDDDKRPFSIASTPAQAQLELHIGGAVTDPYASQALAHLQQHAEITAEVGLGQAFWREDSQNPIILLAGGTGFSYVYSIAQAIAAAAVKRPVFLYWGVRDQSALYHLAELQQWADTDAHYRFIPVVQNPDTDWQGRSGLVHEAVLADFVSLEAYDIYLAGPFAMAGVVRSAFLEQGGKREQMFADAFAYI
ncbi:NAD(P)H-flavin reductase [Rheinheimera sp.]|uniref:NAD(P)H-flavin reductase n=1 Tax=Rheinheimera sp. TaxID=1869214 RepID=UPI00307F54AF